MGGNHINQTEILNIATDYNGLTINTTNWTQK